MKTKLLCAAFILLSSGWAGAAENSLVGRWISERRPNGNLALIMTFAEDGVVTSTVGSVGEYHYVEDGGKLRLTPMNGNPAIQKPINETYTLQGDKMLVSPSDDLGARRQRVRVGKAIEGAPPLVGLWTFMSENGAPATYQYTRGGLALLSVPKKVFRGHYKLENRDLTIEMEGAPAAKWKVQIGQKRMLLRDPGPPPREERYTRILP